VGARLAVIHVGAPKTGSTYLQALLWRNRATLRARGVEMLGAGQAQHYRAGKDIRDIPFDPGDPGVNWTGAWDRMAERARASASPVVVISDEHLASVTPQQAERAVASLAPREVHIVYVTRDLPGLLPSEWQEYVKHGSVLDYSEWVTATFHRPDRPPGRWFWSVHDAASVVRRWTAMSAAKDVHVIAMPSEDAPRLELWTRFARVLGCEPEPVIEDALPANQSLGLVAAEVLRRVNATLPPDFPAWHRTGLVRDVLANVVLAPLGRDGRPRIPPDLEEEVLSRARSMRAELLSLGCTIIGPLPPLATSLDTGADSTPLDADAVCEVAIEAIAGLVTELARTRDDRQAFERRIREQHAHEAARFARRHPVARRLEDGRARLAAAEGSSRAVAALLKPYRRLRAHAGD
jgi:hypothetical protein